MAFFDDVGRKISNFSQSAVQKTKGVADGARINSNITEEERNLNNIYCDLGRAYYQLHAKDPEPQLKNIVFAAAETEKKLSFLYQQLRDIQGLVRCPLCGNMAPSNSMFCNACGSKLPHANQPMNGSQCPQCGNMITFPTKFCNKCGFKIENAVPAPTMPIPALQSASPAGIVPPAVPVPAASNISNCPKCGAAINGNLKFCTMCGEKIEINNAVVDQASSKSNLASTAIKDNNSVSDLSGQPVPAVMPDTNETVTCNNCGTTVRAGLKFCTNCGTKMNSENKNTADNGFDDKNSSNVSGSDVIKCKVCGESVKPGVRFCTSCGAAMNDNSNVSENTDQNQPVASANDKLALTDSSVPDKAGDTVNKNESDGEQPSEQNISKCPVCGSTVKKGLKFCVSCGTKLSANKSDNASSISSDKADFTSTKDEDKQENQVIKPEVISKPDSAKKTDIPDFLSKKEDSAKTSDSDSMKCPNCGSQIKKGLKFCVSCGTRLSSAESIKPFLKVSDKEELPASEKDDKQNAQVIKPDVISKPDSAKKPDIPDFLSKKEDSAQISDPDNMKCPNCGSQIKKGLKFCVSCGTRLSSAESINPFLKVSDKEELPASKEDDKQKTQFAVSEVLTDFDNNKELEKTDLLSKKDDTPKNSDTDNMKCPSCGSKIRKGLKFCVACGTRLTSANNVKLFSSVPAVTAEDEKQKNKAADLKIPTDFAGNKKSEKSADSDKITCPNCGKQIKKGLKFCVSCGTKISSTDNAKPFQPVSKKDDELRTVAAVPEELLELDENKNDDKQQSEKPDFLSKKNDTNKSPDTDKITCPSCGSQIKKGLKFCVSCGAKLSVTENSSNPPIKPENNETKCPGCGAAVKKGLNFCVSCGFKLTSANASQSSLPPEAPTNPEATDKHQNPRNMPPIAPNANNGKKRGLFNNLMQNKADNNAGSLCPNCGSKTKPGLKFCVSCGTRLIPSNSLRPPLPPMQSNESANMPKANSDNNLSAKTFGIPDNGMNSADDNDFKTTFADLEAPKTSANSESSFGFDEKSNPFGNNESSLKQQSNGVIKCSHCGSKVESNLKFCTVCGNKLSTPDIGTNNSQPAFSAPVQSQTSSLNYNLNNFENGNEIKCPSCNSKINAGLKFCTVCGTKLNNQGGNSSSQQEKSFSSNKKKCMKCGALEDASMFFCTSCGSSLTNEDGGYEKKSLDDNVPFGKKKCKNCGTVLDSDMRFCTSCGASLGGALNSAPSKSAANYNSDSNKTVYAVSVESDFGNKESSLPNDIPFSGLPFGVHNPLKGKLCPKCNSLMSDDLLFCTECGTRL